MPVDPKLLDVIEKNRGNLPRNRKPCILVCGGTGAGKTTTINTLFGTEMGAVGHFARGTASDQLYVWEARGEYIDIVDLPGLGDSRERDREYREIYRRKVEEAHGFIVVTTPPRPAALPTLRTVNLLLECGVPARKIVIGFNRLTLLNVEEDGELRPLELAGLGGPLEQADADRIEEARQALLSDLRDGTKAPAFTLEQVVAYDALTGWNLFALLEFVAAGLPGDTLVPWSDAVSTAAARAAAKQEKRAERDRRRIAELEAQLLHLNSAREADREYFEKAVKKRKKAAKKDAAGKDDTLKQGGEHQKGVVHRFGDWVAAKGYPVAGKAIREVAEFGRRLSELWR